MDIQHLSEVEVNWCADSIATGFAAESVNDKSKRHLNECEQCQELVNNEAQLLKIKYSNEIANCLNNPISSTNNSYLRFVAIALIIIAGMVGFIFITDNFLLVLN